MKLVLKKKKNVLKTKANLHFVHRKTSKGKKKMKRKEINKGISTAKKIVLRNLILNLRRGIAALILVEDIEVTNNEEDKT